MKRLGVNIDHIATLRNARGEKHPDPINAAKKVISYGADSVTIHLREDRRHINDIDAKKICALKNVLVNLEISMNKEIVNKALKIKPNFICLVPENRKEITTEGCLNIKNNYNKLEKIIKKFKKAKAKLIGFASIIDRSTKQSLKIKTGITSHLKIEVPTYKANKLPPELKSIPITTPGSRFI